MKTPHDEIGNDLKSHNEKYMTKSTQKKHITKKNIIKQHTIKEQTMKTDGVDGDVSSSSASVVVSRGWCVSWCSNLSRT